MSAREQLDADFREILAGEFSRGVILHHEDSNQPDIETTGIYDDSYEPIQNQEGATAIGRFVRVLIHWASLPDFDSDADLEESFQPYRNIDVEDDRTGLFVPYTVRNVQKNSEGDVLLELQSV